MISVLIVDDSATVRAYLRSLLEEDPEVRVVGEASDGLAAVGACAALMPQVVTMDLVMPHGGVEAIRRIMDENPTPIVIVSALAEYEKDLTVFEGLAAGALAVVRRPPSARHPDFAERQRELLEAVKSAAGIALIRRPLKARGSTDERQAPSALQLVGVAASTGGPAALLQFFRALPAGFAPSLLVVQHITPGFASGFVEWLSGSSPVPVQLARSGMRHPWRGALVAPDGAHLTIYHGTVSLEDSPLRNGHRPSADALFESMAGWRPRASVGILMTGMGEDGAQGLGRLRRSGGRTMVQSEETCVVFGMPGTALRAGAAERALSPTGLAQAVVALAEAA